MEKCDKCGEFIEFARLCPLCAHYEKERADFLESEVEEYSEKYPSLYRDFAAEKERADKYEALTQELVEVLDVVLSEDSIPMSEWLESKERLKKIHSKAKEVLENAK